MSMPLKLKCPLLWIWMLLYCFAVSCGDVSSTRSNVMEKSNVSSICTPSDTIMRIPSPCTKNYVCTGISGQNVTIQCGGETYDGGHSYTYTLFGNNKNLSHPLQLTLEPNVNSQTVYCYSNEHVSTTSCYELNVKYAPIEDEPSVLWPNGYSHTARHGEPFGLNCPLHSNPPANYSWVRYRSIDQEEKLDLPNDLTFYHNQQQWIVDDYVPSSHNGFYVCHAWNSLGNASYNGMLFNLNVDSCTYPDTGNNMLNIHPSTEVLYVPSQSTVTLECTLSPVEKIRHIPTWYIIVNGSYIKPSYHNDFISQEISYNHSLCQWTDILTIRNFSKEFEGNYYCKYSHYSKNQTIALELDFEDYSSAVNKYSIVATTVVALVLVVVIVIGVMLTVYLKRRGTPFYEKYKEPPSDGYDYDVFISANDEIRGLIEERILKPLEEQCSPPYTVCWHHRDFIAGFNIAEQIAECVHTKARKIMFVFSENFTSSPFCTMELKQAVHRLLVTNTRCIIPITLSDNVVPTELKTLLTYWPIIHTDDDSFVEKLIKLIGEPISVTQSDGDHLMFDITNEHAIQDNASLL